MDTAPAGLEARDSRVKPSLPSGEIACIIGAWPDMRRASSTGPFAGWREEGRGLRPGTIKDLAPRAWGDWFGRPQLALEPAPTSDVAIHALADLRHERNVEQDGRQAGQGKAAYQFAPP